MESHLRSWAKSATWRLIGIVILGAISFAITRDLGQTTVITGVFHLLRFVLYYYHERAWERIAWGKGRHPLAHLPVKTDLAPEDHEEIRKLLADRQYLVSKDYEI